MCLQQSSKQYAATNVSTVVDDDPHLKTFFRSDVMLCRHYMASDVCSLPLPYTGAECRGCAAGSNLTLLHVLLFSSVRAGYDMNGYDGVLLDTTTVVRGEGRVVGVNAAW